MTRSTFFNNNGESSGNSTKKIKNRINAVESTIADLNGIVQSDGNISCNSIDCTGISKASEHVNIQDGTSVKGYGMFHFNQTGTDYDMNSTFGKAIRWSNKHSDTSLYTIQGADNEKIRVNTAGFFEVSFTVYCTSTTTRSNPTIGLFKNGATFTGIGAWSFIKGTNDHNESTWTASPGIVYMDATDYFSVVGVFTSTGGTGAVYLVNSSFNGIGQIRPYILIKRIS